MNILIVDDNPTNRKVLRVTLEAEGLTVFEAEDGTEALRVLDREEIAAVISDVLMPRMDGYRLCYEVRRSERHKKIPFIFYTNTYTSPSDEQLGLQLGAQAFIRKPAAADVILNALRTATAGRSAARPPLATLDETDVLKEYSERLVAKLEEKNIALAEQTEALLKVEQQLRLQATTLESAANAILVTDRAGAIQWVNPAFSKLTGYTPEEVIGQTPRMLKSGKHDAAFYRDLWRTILSGQTWRGEFTNRRKDGSFFHDEHTITPIRSKSGEITNFVGILHDVTARKRAEEAVAHRARLAALSAEVSLALTHSGVLRDMLRRCAESLVTYLDAAFARIWTLNEKENVLELQASAGIYTHLDGPHGRVPVGQFKIGLIAQERKPHLTNSVVGDPRVSDQDWAKREGMVAFAGYPIVVENRLVGVMALFARRALTDATLTALASVADGIGVGIERKRAEEGLQESERRFREMLENVELISMTLDKNGRVTFCNDYLLRLTGWEREEVIGADWFERFIPEANPEVKKLFFDTIEAGTIPLHHENPIKTRGGELRQIVWNNTMLRDAAGKFIGTASIGDDVTARRKAEQRLATHHTVTRTLAEPGNLPETAKKILEIICRDLQWDLGELWTVDRTSGRLRCVEIWHPPSTEFNEFVAVSRTTTFAAGEGLPGTVWQTGRPKWIADVGSEANLPRKALAMRLGLRSGVAFPIRLRDETFGVVVFLSARMREPDEELAAMFATMGSQIGSFIERGRMEEQFHQSQKMEAFGQLAGGVAHDFNNVLAVIMGYTNLLMEEEKISGHARDQLQQVFAAGERAANLTRQLLTFSRKKEMQARVLDLNEVLGNMIKMLGRIIGEDVKLQCEYGSKLPPLRADAGMIEQVIMNLAVNARDAMPKGGQLLITTHEVTLDSAAAQRNPEARPGDFVRLSVRDTGCGMPPEIRARIFEPFFTTKGVGKGTGLGLATVYGIVKQHQGWIEVESQVGTGTTFNILFPASARADAVAELAATQSKLRGGTETILLVEDEAAVRGMAKIILQRQGYQVFEAESGAAALAVWERHGARIDLLLTDMVMPDGLSGWDLAKELTARKPALKVIFCSGYSVEMQGTSFRLREGRKFLQKPYHPHKLVQTIRDCLDGKPD